MIGKIIKINNISFKVERNIPRCNAINLKPETDISDTNLLRSLKKSYDHFDMGVYLRSVDEGKIEVHTKYQLGSVSGNEKVESINIKHDDESVKEIKTDYVLGFFGLIMQLGPVAEWGLNLDKKTVPVNTENFETNKEGIFAIGDICTYPGKLKLILSGFHEGALAARGCFKYAKPDEKYRFEFTTSSKTVKSRLGVKE